MKVLWFTNTPSLGARYLNSTTVGGGWIESLEEQITKTPGLELGIVFKWGAAEVPSFNEGKTTYYPVYKPLVNGRIKKIANRWKHVVEYEENQATYLDIIQKFKPDIIHIFGTENDFGLIISKTSIPCIIHIQGNLTVYNHKWFSGISLLDLMRFSKKGMFLKGNGFIHEYLLYKKETEREKQIFQNCHFFMGRTDWDKRIALSLSPKSKYFHCEEMLRNEFHQHQWNKVSSDKNYTIFTTIRKNIYKGLETILECKKILQKSFPEFNIQWKVAGIKNEDELTLLIERKYKEKFSDNNILLLGPLKINPLINEMLAADIFIHPSHIDNSPNSVCEAMLLGMPIIATYAGGIPSLIQDKKEGLLVQDGDPYALCGSIIELLNDKKNAANFGMNARTRALARNNDQTIVSRVLDIYNAVILNNESKPATVVN